ncbi:thymosin beta-10-like [Mustela putorius furo]|uniref:Thymosin beta-10 n=1 Tax=Mustela putorius furo TaxID=9669 RepID=A0A8U0RJL5_MUSPF|nr:thymosin beta-10-like [Mustela putorius furo]
MNHKDRLPWKWGGVGKPEMGSLCSFNKAKLKKTETQENTLPTKETTEQEKWSEIS